MDTDEEKHFEYALGFAVLRRWADLCAKRSSFCSMRRLLATTAFERGLRPFCTSGIATQSTRSNSLTTTSLDRRRWPSAPAYANSLSCWA